MACRDEAHDHDHDHDHSGEGDGHGHHGHGHSHDEAPDELKYGASLFKYIHLEQVTCLNESIKGGGKSVMKSLSEGSKTIDTVYVESSPDSRELLLKIPLTDIVCLRSVSVDLHSVDTKPSRLLMWKDKPTLDFSDVSDGIQSDETFHLIMEESRRAKYFTKIRKWTNTQHVTMLFTSESEDSEDESEDDESKSEEETPIRVSGVYLFGEFKSVKPKAVVTVYESKPMAKDHETKTEDGGQSSYIS